MKILLSLPENAVENIELLTKNGNNCFAISDPEGEKIGSGGGTSWLVSGFLEKEPDFKGKKIIIHAGGQSRRLPAYAPLGKSFIPCPVFRWERAQRMSQTLMDLQLPLLENLMSAAPEGVNTLISSGDTLIWSESFLEKLPEADVICIGICVDPVIASNHGVFVSERRTPDKLEYMLQKPDHETLKRLNIENLFLIDSGIWLLSDRALNVIMRKSGWNPETCSYRNNLPDFYDLYGTFGLSLGSNPSVEDSDISALTTAIITLDDGRFFHFGTSSEIISSSLELQNMVVDQRSIWNKNIKPHPSIFTQNSIIKTTLSDKNENLWIENSFIPESWNLTRDHIVTGIPGNNWMLSLGKGICLDIIPVNNNDFCIRCYHISDKFRGKAGAAGIMFMGTVFKNWAVSRGFSPEDLDLNPETDIYDAAIFPVLPFSEITSEFLSWFVNGTPNNNALDTYLKARKLSSADILVNADINRLEEQRKNFRAKNWKTIRKNYKKSVFFQTDLLDAAEEFKKNGIEFSRNDLTGESDPQILMQDFMFQSLLCSEKEKAEKLKRKAFGTLQQAIIDTIVSGKSIPQLNVFEDQIVWARSPVRIDLAGGWTDTPPYCVINGGSVVGVSLELNGQPPLQAFIRPSKEKLIILRSIDLGEREVISTFEELAAYYTVGSAFSIPKAALALAGFHPDFSAVKYKNLEQQMDDFGSGIEISFLAAIPKGSGMGTSSILAATILGAVSDFCNLNWDQTQICSRTLVLEQMLTTGGGWQDQYGGIVPGLKLLKTGRGWSQTPEIRWLPDFLFTRPEYKDCMLLYYTGITRVAKNILEDIVQGMFLNENKTYSLLKEMKRHAEDTYDVIQRGLFREYGEKIARSWRLNNELDADTNNSNIQSIIEQIQDYTLGFKLPGAGGGGFLYIVAKDPDAALRIRQILSGNPPNKRARFIDMNISQKGLQISRS